MSRISIEVDPEIHRAVRASAASQGITVRQFVLEALHDRLKQQANRQDTEETFRLSLPALERDWNNALDAEYDDLGESPLGREHALHSRRVGSEPVEQE